MHGSYMKVRIAYYAKKVNLCSKVYRNGCLFQSVLHPLWDTSMSQDSILGFDRYFSLESRLVK